MFGDFKRVLHSYMHFGKITKTNKTMHFEIEFYLFLKKKKLIINLLK